MVPLLMGFEYMNPFSERNKGNYFFYVGFAKIGVPIDSRWLKAAVSVGMNSQNESDMKSKLIIEVLNRIYES